MRIGNQVEVSLMRRSGETIGVEGFWLTCFGLVNMETM
jgi:hypothetical protein